MYNEDRHEAHAKKSAYIKMVLKILDELFLYENIKRKRRSVDSSCR
jgi:hypothetical protein